MDPATARRPPVRMNPQDGPWSVSVAETPDDPRSYSLYIKTPTHNLTLTRTAAELVDLDRKLREAYPTANLQELPIDASGPPKRKTKSTFLNTLSRLASPNTNRANRRPTPLTSPQTEAGDPFIDAAPPTSQPVSALAAYLTTVSNAPAMRQARPWKRFVRVRTDDLESVRVERAIKRVRSDLASHTGGGLRNKDKENIAVEQPVAEDIPPTPATDATVTSTAVVAAEVEVAPPPPEAALAAPEQARIPRSQSADPDKSSRLSRAFTNQDEQTDPEELTSSRETDDSSISTTGHDASAPKKRASKKKLRALSVGPRKSTRKVVIDDFEMMRVLGKGCAGKVLLVKHKTSSALYALKAITKRHVLAHQELQHTLTEQAVLKRMAAEGADPFVVKLWWSFHDKENLFLVMDFHPGGDLATQLARWGRLGRDRARFYAAEIVEGVEGLHAAGVIYRDLKPENILIGGDGHIVLTDFGLSKEFPRRTTAATAPSTPRGEFYSAAPGGAVVSANGSTVPATPPWMKADKPGGELAAGWPGPPVGVAADTTTTFCGTAEYLAPEVIQGLAYSYEVDWWSFGTMLYEMLTGITPFWANNHSDMYVRVLQDELQFPDDRAIDQDTKSLIRGLLQRNPALRICEPRIKRHPYFSMIDWSHVYYKRYIPPYIPPIDPSNASDTQNFDDTFLDMEPVLDDANEGDEGDTDAEPATDGERTDGDGDESNTTPSQSRSSSVTRPAATSNATGGAGAAKEDDVDVFDGYSFKGRHSVLLDDDEDDGEGSDGSGESEEEEEEEDEGVLRNLDLGPGMEVEPETPRNAIEAAPAEEGGEAGEVAEPKTPEARPVVPVDPVPELPTKKVEEADTITEEPRAAQPAVVEPAPAPVVAVREEPKPRKSKEHPAPPVPEKEPILLAPPLVSKRLTARPRREKSGVPALDRHLEVGEGEATEKEDETDADLDDGADDDWDFVEAADGEDRNGAKGTSLFARGVVDRYRLAVFRKASTPSGAPREPTPGATSDTGDSPSPSQRRGRSGAGLTFRKHPRQFLRPRSPPPSSFSSKSSLTKSMSMTNSNSATLSASSSSGPLLSPSLSATTANGAMSPSLKSKESAMSVGAQSSSSGENGGVLSDSGGRVRASVASSPPEGLERQKTKKLKKLYKDNAEKVLSFLSSPRQPNQPI
ncbi:kinase-like protein [Mycena maculata]|uniref:non-specific serine/threonine protein kinase n=1 Tax=Mycena maculata TaxID=230809 RepID=A0AAD7JF22_9AGAR|nr:kinase-like protein [Mycena maculata]